MEETNNPIEVNYPPEVQSTENNSKLKKMLKTKNLLIAAVLIFIIIVPALLFSVKSVKEKEPRITPTEVLKPSIIPFPSEGNYVKNQLIVQYREGRSPADLIDNDERSKLASALSELGVISQEILIKDQETNLQNYYVLTFSDDIDIKDAVEGLSKIPEILTVEPNATFNLF